MIVMGYVAGAQGILGWVKIKTYTEYVDGLGEYSVWWLGNGRDSWFEARVENHAVHGRGLVAKFLGTDDRSAAEKYKGLLVAVPRSSLPKNSEDEYYWSDLIGLQVVNLAGESLGVVDNLLDTGANQVLCVRGSPSNRNQDDLLIPFISSAIRKVDLSGKKIQVDWSEDWAENTE